MMKANAILITAALVLGSFSLQGQGLKIGYTNADYILSKMPEAKQIESELKTHQEQLGAQIKSKRTEFEQKYQSFTDNQKTMTEVVRNDSQRELQTMQESIQKFASEADRSLKNKQIQLLSPVYQKIDSTIQIVALEHGFSHVFSNESLLYATEENDISNLVLAKLGIDTGL